MSYSVVQGQQGMALDARRNEAYAKALEQVITPDSVVLDVGAGLGIHGLLAAQLGAKRVYLVEPEDIISVATQIAKANGFGDRVVALKGKIEDVQLPEKVDVIISVFTGNFLLEEDLLPSLFYARDTYLKPNGTMIPSAAVMEAVPVSAPELYYKEIESWSTPHMNIDPSVARSYANQAIYYYSKALPDAVYLAEPSKLMALDFYTATATDCKVEVRSTITTAGTCHGWAGWFKMLLGETWLSTAPHEPALHWSPAFLPIDPAVDVSVGETVTFKLQRPMYGSWTWRVKTATTQQQRSTFFSVPLTLGTSKKLAYDHHPQLTDSGRAALAVLSQCDGTRSVEALSQQVQREYPHLFPNSKKAINFVQKLVGAFG